MHLDTERQLDVYDCLVEASGDTCPECPDPASCQAEGECQLHTEQLLTGIFPAWDPIS